VQPYVAQKSDLSFTAGIFNGEQFLYEYLPVKRIEIVLIVVVKVIDMLKVNSS